MSAEKEPEDELTRTSVLRAHFGDSFRFWVWIRKQFSPASIGVIISIVIGAGGYILHLRETILAVTTRVVVLETEVVPAIGQADHTALMDGRLKALDEEVKDMHDRIGRLEQNWDRASDVVSIPNDKLLLRHGKRK